MLTIAVMTMVFLPGGFVAAFFSMSIFSFQPQEGPQIVSSWIWLYFVVTLTLMAAVFGIWRVFTR
ncbi:hypothetical protein B0T24DRAFT_617151 [Lasiosphaeria ovina]|uniref:Uncharacterized protein n=1 Tax=Lasiosphaeria ovina TaxID=92902 RepID=A0AAE0KHD8_9PEZI|nr:hypothetical protein B0T24DRAFT_617151 [Lasiosphaeria ovina]